MNVKKALQIIDKMRDDWYTHPETYRKKKPYFEFQSYKCSAMDEILLYLTDHDDMNPIFLLEEFRHMVDRFACEAGTSKTNFMFSVYYDVATDVLDVLLEADKPCYTRAQTQNNIVKKGVKI